jgi:hypothetical protein
MKMSKKTISIELVKNWINDILLNSADELKDYRIGSSYLLEKILSESGNYKGFRYLDENDMKNSEMGKSIGIVFDETGKIIQDFPDTTRKSYT